MSNDSPVIYVIDDVSAFREVIKGMLEEMGFDTFVEAADGAEALEKLRKTPATLILCDHMMSPVNGVELLQEVKKDPTLQKIPFIMISAVSETTHVVHARSLGLDDYLVKPVRYTALQQSIVKALAGQMS